jgi:hypothetical protein
MTRETVVSLAQFRLLKGKRRRSVAVQFTPRSGSARLRDSPTLRENLLQSLEASGWLRHRVLEEDSRCRNVPPHASSAFRTASSSASAPHQTTQTRRRAEVAAHSSSVLWSLARMEQFGVSAGAPNWGGLAALLRGVFRGPALLRLQPQLNDANRKARAFLDDFKLSDPNSDIEPPRRYERR